MRTPIWIASLCLAAAFVQPMAAQDATPDQIQRALELLRQTETGKSSTTDVPPPVPPIVLETPSTPAIETVIQPEVIQPIVVQPTTPPPPAFPKATLVEQTLTREQEDKALQLLRSINSATDQPTVAAPSRPTFSDEERARKIQDALRQAEGIVTERKRQQQLSPAVNSEVELQQEITRIESEILKAKGVDSTLDNTYQAQPVQVIETITTPATVISTTGNAGTLTNPGQSTDPNSAMNAQDELRARQLLDQVSREIFTPTVVDAEPVTETTITLPTTVDTQLNTDITLPTTANTVQETTITLPTTTTPVVPTTTITLPTTPAAPSTPVLSGSQEERLTELLRAYQASEVTPAEYHRQRSLILRSR